MNAFKVTINPAHIPDDKLRERVELLLENELNKRAEESGLLVRTIHRAVQANLDAFLYGVAIEETKP